jgi:hypothetical protein
MRHGTIQFVSIFVSVHRFSAASDRRNGQFDRKRDSSVAESHTRVQRSAPPLATEVASLIKKVTMALPSHIGGL